MKLKASSFSAITLAAVTQLAIAASMAPPAITTEGSVRGKREGSVDAYLGIPYARPPIGNLRWRSPERAVPWKGVRDATRFGTNCYQAAPARFGPFTTEFLISLPVTEDCLYLNAWTPAERTKSLPVFVWIHGGGFGSGSGSVPIYDGASLASRGVVVINMNYRLGVFGFLAHPELTKESAEHSSGNYGLQDIIAALKWVRSNVAHFGGDPARVTIAGQSAGAAAVNDLLMSAEAKGLFQYAIAQSGSGMGLAPKKLSDAEAVGVAFIKAAGASAIADLRKMSAEAVFNVKLPPPAENSGNPAPRISFAPNIDGSVLVANPERGQLLPQSNVPLLTGFNADETGLDGIKKTTGPEFEAYMRRLYGAFAARFLTLYPHATNAEASKSMNELIRDRYMAGLLLWTEERVMATDEPVYTYLFDHPYPGPEVDQYGTFHTAEVPYVFGVLQQSGRVFSKADQQVSDQLQRYWTNFLSSGNPNGPGLKLWSKAPMPEAKVMGLGDKVGPRLAISSLQRMMVFREYSGHGGKLSLF